MANADKTKKVMISDLFVSVTNHCTIRERFYACPAPALRRAGAWDPSCRYAARVALFIIRMPYALYVIYYTCLLA